MAIRSSVVPRCDGVDHRPHRGADLLIRRSEVVTIRSVRQRRPAMGSSIGGRLARCRPSARGGRASETTSAVSASAPVVPANTSTSQDLDSVSSSQRHRGARGAGVSRRHRNRGGPHRRVRCVRCSTAAVDSAKVLLVVPLRYQRVRADAVETNDVGRPSGSEWRCDRGPRTRCRGAPCRR